MFHLLGKESNNPEMLPSLKKHETIHVVRNSQKIYKFEMEKRNVTYNFSAGPGAMPTSVLLQAQKEMLDYKGLGMSFMEMTHRDAGPVQDLMTGD